VSVHKITLVGYLGKDPDTKTLPSGSVVTNTSLATSERWKDKHGEKQERTTWFNLAFFGKLAEIAAEYLRKGSLVYVEGQVATRAWISKQNGEAQSSLEVTVRELKILGGRQSEPRARSEDDEPAPKQQDEFDDDIPF